MNFRSMFALITFLLVLHCFETNGSLNFYVSKLKGNDDDNSGRYEHDAFKTLNKAQETIRTFKRYNDHYNDDIVVNIEGGTYEESLYFDSKDSGFGNGTYIKWRSYPKNNKMVRISGGQQIDISSFYSCRSPFSSNSHIELLCANLSSLGITDIGSMISGGLVDCQHNKLELYYNGKPQILSRYPNINYDTNLYQYTTITKAINDTTFMYRNNEHDINDWDKESDGWMHGYWFTDWFDTYSPIDDIQRTDNNYYITSKGDNFLAQTNARYFISVLIHSKLL